MTNSEYKQMATITGEDPEKHSLKYTRWFLIILFQLALASLVTWFVSQFWPVWKYYPENHYWDFSPHIGLPLAAGIFLAGELAIRLGWLADPPKYLQRFVSTVVGAYFPILIIFIYMHIAQSLIFLFMSMVTAFIGFYFPEWIERRAARPETAGEGALERHPLFLSISLHLLPGAAMMTFFLYALPIVKNAGYPSPFALIYAILLVQIPLEAGILLIVRLWRSWRGSNKPVILYREPIPIWQYFVLTIVLLGIGSLVYMLLRDFEESFNYRWWSWMPNWFADLSSSSGGLHDYPLATWKSLAGTALLVNGIFGSAVEEIYFRGYLLPRIPGPRNLAPLVNTVLFSLYHFYSPMEILARIGGFLPIAYAAETKRNIYSGIIAHCLMNIVAIIFLYIVGILSYAD